METIKRECLKEYLTRTEQEQFPNAVVLQQLILEFRDYYNGYRLHCGIGYEVPSVRYCGFRPAQTLRAVPQLRQFNLPGCSPAEPMPDIDLKFIQQHKALVAT